VTDEPAADSPGSAAAAAEADDAIRVELSEFEGPLDLLLHLVKKHELEILNIPIAFITDQYLKYLARMQALDLDVAGEYLLMAATLAALKSRELLPPSPEEEAAAAALDGEDGDGLDPRQELIRRLLEYQKYKEAAAQLGERPVVGRNVWLRGMPAHLVAGIDSATLDQAPLAEVPVFQLIESLEKVLARARVKLTHDVVVDRISITDKIHEMVDRLEREGSFTFASCFDFVDRAEAAGLRHQIVVTFLALLEMTRLKMIGLHQPAEHGEIYISRGTAPQAAPSSEEQAG
jgi:segregation and condensation protein A